MAMEDVYRTLLSFVELDGLKLMIQNADLKQAVFAQAL